MSDIAIRVEGLGKRYEIGELASIRDVPRIARRLLSAPFRAFGGTRGQNDGPIVDESRHFWALRNLNFEVRHGEVLGVIGRNGAGKSTLLKVLSRITSPTSGRADVFGRVASLLEVGTGFHPDLTGRENVYLNGAILGMSRKEIDERFEQIIDFAGVEKFIDTPFKRYSSGMRVRLGFAVAAHLEPEILIVDEVLAVGDAEFQRKCLSRMSDVASKGRTVLFVSHNLPQVARLCQRGLVLEGGEVRCHGDIDTALESYNQLTRGVVESISNSNLTARFSVSDEVGMPLKMWHYGEAIRIEVTFESSQPISDPAVDLTFHSEQGVRVFGVRTDRLERHSNSVSTFKHRKRIHITNIGLACASLTVDLGIRHRSENSYLGVWKSVATISISTIGNLIPPSPNTVISLPTEMIE